MAQLLHNLGLLRIVDRLRVAPAATMSDREIFDHVVKALLAEPAW
jgi:hypothetical protein